jgi:hypothetical protein
MSRPALRLTLVLLALALLAPASAAARYHVRVGVGDQSLALFSQPLFQRAKIERVRYFVHWDAARHPAQLRAAEDYVRTAAASGIQVLVHVSTDDLRPRRAHLPSVAAYRRDVGRLVRALRPLGVREWGVWNEANHPSQPTWDHPARAAAYYRVMRGICPGCTIVALDVLDERTVSGYVARFYRALPRGLRRHARIVGIHNYSDVNRRRAVWTPAIMRTVRGFVGHPRFWLTETGGIVELGGRFHCSTARAADRLSYLFRLLRTYRRSIDRAYVYNWFGTSCRTRMDTGIVNRDGTARRSYAALRRGLSSFLR